MSVYRPKKKDGSFKSSIYVFDFELKPAGAGRSQRFTGSTGQKTEKAARRVEDQLRELAKLGKLGNLMTLAEGTTRYIREKAPKVPPKVLGVPDSTEVKAKRQALRQQVLCMTELLTYFGEDTPLMAITPDDVSRAVAQRENTETVRWKKVGDELLPIPTGKFPKPGTVNRQIVGPLRRVLRRARIHWGVPIDLEKFQWGGEDGVMLEEPTERVRELTAAEELRFWPALNLEYHDLCELYIITGKRQSSWLKVPKFRVDLEHGIVKMRKLKKRREEWVDFQLTERELEIVRAAYERDPGSEFLFNATSQSPRDRGARIPITTRMLYDNVMKAFKAAGINDIRPHDFRHTFASRALRKDGNLKKLMGAMDHSSLSSTLRYTHVLQDEVKGMRENVSVTKELPEGVTRMRKKGAE